MSKIEGNILATCVLEFKESRFGGEINGLAHLDDDLVRLTGLPKKELDALFLPVKAEFTKFVDVVGVSIIKKKGGKGMVVNPDDDFIEFLKAFKKLIDTQVSGEEKYKC